MSAPPVVLLHGCGGTVHATFAATGWIEALRAGGRSVVAPDLPGHGRREVSTDPAAYADLAGELSSALPAGGLDLVGFSLGAKLALEIAVREPRRVRRLVLGGVGDNVFAPEGIAPLAALALEQRASDAARHPAVGAMLAAFDDTRNDARAIAAVLRRPPNPVFTAARLAAITCPVLVVNGSADPVAREGERLAAALPAARLEWLADVDHFGLPAAPAFRRLALDFLGTESH